MKTENAIGLAFFALLLGIYIGAIIEQWANSNRLRREAIELGFAERVIVDKINGGEKWQWRPSKDNSKPTTK